MSTHVPDEFPASDALAAERTLEEPPLPNLHDLFEEHADHVGNTLRRLGVRDADAPDLVQEVFIVVHRILADYDRERPMWPWLFGICYRTAAAYRRKAAREVFDDGAMTENRADSAEDVVETMRREEDRRLVLAAIQHVALPRRAVFIMADIDGVGVPDIARALGLSVNTAYSRLRLAREDFRAAVVRLTKVRDR